MPGKSMYYMSNSLISCFYLREIALQWYPVAVRVKI